MLFVVFMIVVWTAALFHRREHRRLPDELAKIDTRAAYETGQKIDGHDWRVIADTKDRLVMKRAFEPVGMEGKLRYTLPVVLLAVMMIWLQSIPATVFYMVFLCIRWFALRVEIEKGADPVFHVLAGTYHIYEDKIP